MVKLKEQYRNIPVYQPGKSTEEVIKEFNLSEVIKLASNENPYGASHKIKNRLIREMDHLPVYPDDKGVHLKEKLANLYTINTEQIIIGNGSDEIIQYLSRVYLNAKTEVIMAMNTFPMYKLNAIMEDANIVEVPLINGTHDLDAMANAVTDNTSLIWVCNPNNPTGTIVYEDELIVFLEKIPENVLVVVDEAYAEYVTDRNYPDTIKLMKKYSNLMILRTFSKIYGLAGLRIGYGIANIDVIQDLMRVKEPFNANHLAQVCAEEALEDQDFVQSCKEQNHTVKAFFMNELEQLGITYFSSETNFLLFKHSFNDEWLFHKLLKEGIIVRPGNKLGLPGTIRITIGTMEQMTRVIQTLRQFFIGGMNGTDD